jgi:membrane protein required for colicin V production
VTLDLVCLALVVTAAVAGAVAGAVSQLGQLAAVAGGWLGARWATPYVAPLLQGRVPAFAAHPLATVAAFLACTVVVMLLVRVVLVATPLRRVPGSGGDRGLGALLGAAKAALALWVVLSALATWGKPLPFLGGDLDPSRSELVGLAREHGALGMLSPAPRSSPTTR